MKTRKQYEADLEPTDSESEAITRAWRACYDKGCLDKSEDIITWTFRRDMEQKLKLLHGATIVWENNPETKQLYDQAVARYNYYRDLYEHKQFE